MSNVQPAQGTRRRVRSTFLAVLVAVPAVTALIGCRSLASWSGLSPLGTETFGHSSHERIHGNVPDKLPGQPPVEHQGALNIADGTVPDGVTVFEDEYPAVANLDPHLLGALREAATSAAADDVQLFVDSGWRSRKYQAQLFQQAVWDYGSTQEATRWVAPPGTSPHEAGEAVDVGPSDATSWLSGRGAQYGLCQIYRNEPWHYELRPEAVDRGCPSMYADPTDDPRMQQ